MRETQGLAETAGKKLLISGSQVRALVRPPNFPPKSTAYVTELNQPKSERSSGPIADPPVQSLS
jgi:hypothetical protein